MKCKRRFMHGKRRRKSPLRQDTTRSRDIDTTWADKVYTREKVDSELDKSGHYTTESARGKKKPSEHYSGKVVSGGKVFSGKLD